MIIYLKILKNKRSKSSKKKSKNKKHAIPKFAALNVLGFFSNPFSYFLSNSRIKVPPKRLKENEQLIGSSY